MQIHNKKVLQHLREALDLAGEMETPITSKFLDDLDEKDKEVIAEWVLSRLELVWRHEGGDLDIWVGGTDVCRSFPIEAIEKPAS